MLCRPCCHVERIEITHECEGQCICNGQHSSYYVKASGQSRHIVTVDLRFRKEL